MLQQMKQLRLDTAAVAPAPRPSDSVASGPSALTPVPASAPTAAPGPPAALCPPPTPTPPARST
eukprot:183683-Pleurochrysis_carterae.AAC.1